MHVPLRLCLDLNIWCAHYHSSKRGGQGSVNHLLVETVRSGASSLGPVQLITSWGMLNRLRSVLERKFDASPMTVDQYLSAIAGYAQFWEARGPSLTLGGVGLLPLTDTEDAHVMDTAIAGETDVLVTANFRDFLPRGVEVLTPDRLARIAHPKGELLIAHPFTVRDWLVAGTIAMPSPSQA